MSKLTEQERDAINYLIGCGCCSSSYAAQQLELIREDDYDWSLAEVVETIVARHVNAALESAAQRVEALPCPGSPPDPLALYAFETAKEYAARLIREVDR